MSTQCLHVKRSYVYESHDTERQAHRERTSVTTTPRNVRRSTASRVVPKWMMGTCERRLPPPPPPRHAARREHTNERRPTPTAAAGPHTDASMRARVHECTRIRTRARSTRREQQWQLRSVSLPPQAVLPPLVFPRPLPPARVKGVDRRGRSTAVPEFVGYEEETLYLSLLMVPLLFSKAVRTKKIQSTSRDTRFLSLRLLAIIILST